MDLSAKRLATFRRGWAFIAIAALLILCSGGAEAAQLTLTWSDASSNEDGFEIQRKTGTGSSFGSLATVGPGTTGYVDGTVTAGSTYCYRVNAYNTAGSSAYSNEACATVATPVNHTVTVAKSGAGTGTITSSPTGIACGATCSAGFASGTSVALSATPATGSTFTGWSGACTGAGSCTLVVDAAKSVTATFGVSPPNTYSLTVATAGTGSGAVTSSPAGINCGATCSTTYASGTSVTLTAAATTGSTFGGWSGAGCSGTGTCTVSMTAARSVTATFTAATGGAPTVSLAASPGGPQGVGTPITATATASGVTNPRYRFWLWNGSAWVVIREWGSSATHTWTPSVANAQYQLGVWVKNGSTAGDAWAAYAAIPAAILPPTVSLAASPGGPQGVGTPITATATTVGVTNPVYRFWLWNGTTWTMIRDWGNNTHTWTPDATGSYQLGVWVKSSSVTEDVGAAYGAAPVMIVPPTVSLAASPGGPQRVGTRITFTAAASGVASPMYRFWRWNGTTWTMVRDWNTSATYAWTPRTANAAYEVGVWVKDSSTAGDAAAAYFSLPVPIQ